MRLLEAVRSLIYSGPKAPKALADEIGIGYGYLTKAADENQPDVQLQARWIGPLTLASGNDILIKQIAYECGGTFVRIARADSRPASILAGISDLSREFSDSIAALTSCLDGTSPREKIDGIQQLSELIDKAAAAREQLQASVAR